MSYWGVAPDGLRPLPWVCGLQCQEHAHGSRLAEASEVTNLVLFLASDEASYITGTEHLVDAGMLAQ
jgi:NAD(P)-dependent dehydrogenase (short-subunit alcohol dehydrogenase family)